MIDMNKLEGVPLYAFNKVTHKWRLASLSGLPGERVQDVFRVDPAADERLEDFVLYQCRWPQDPVTRQPDKNRFITVRPIPDAIAIYS